MITLDKHAKVRYVQRILHITDPQEAAYYLQVNNEKISLDLYEMLANSVLLLEKIPSHNEDKFGRTVDYHMHKNIILVVDSQTRRLVTLYEGALSKAGDFDKEAFDAISREMGRNSHTIKVAQGAKKRLDDEHEAIKSTKAIILAQLAALEEREKEITDSSRGRYYEIKEAKNDNKRLLQSLKEKKSERKSLKKIEDKSLLAYKQTWLGKPLHVLKKQAKKQAARSSQY